MAGEVTVEIKGLDALQQKLQELPPKLAKKDLRAALRAGAAVIKQAMVANAPKETGFTSEHIDTRSRIQKNDIAGSIFIGPNSKLIRPKDSNRKGKTAGMPRTARMIAWLLEFGSRTRGKKPFLTQAFETAKQGALAAIIAKLKDALND